MIYRVFNPKINNEYISIQFLITFAEQSPSFDRQDSYDFLDFFLFLFLLKIGSHS